jgi:methyl-accepting chemotaxis protein
MALQNVPIGARIAALAGMLLLMMALLGGLAWLELRRDAARLDATVEQARTLQESADLARQAQVRFKIQVQEWKNLLLRGGEDPKAFVTYRDGFFKEGDEVRADLSRLQADLSRLGLPPTLVAEALATHATLMERYRAALAQYQPGEAGSAQKVDRLVKGIDRAPTQHIDEIVRQVLQASAKLLEERRLQTHAQLRTLVWGLCVLLLGAIGLGAASAWVIVRGIVRPLRAAVTVAADVADGRLGLSTDAGHGRDETGRMLDALVRMDGSLSHVVGQVRSSAEMVAQATSQIASGNQDLSSRTEAQASSLEQTAAALEQLTAAVRQSADNARHASELSARASQVAEQGGLAVQDVVATMTDIQDSARRINEIIAVIDGIAFQTNILALNASVEAARAGEQGRGFAVVADEVRALAQRSAGAAREIKELIGTSVERAERGFALVTQAGGTIAEAVQAVHEVRSVVAEISTTAGEQSNGISQVNEAIVQMDTATQHNAALVEQAAAAAASLRQQADSLVRAVAFFKLGGV